MPVLALRRDTLTPMPFVWPVDRSDLPPLPALTDPPTDPPTDEYVKAATERNAAENLAVGIMWALSGRQFGVYEHVVRPCVRRSFLRGAPVTSYVVSWEGDRWMSWPCGCVGGCTVGGPRAVHLPGPVSAVTEVRIADAVLDDDAYVLEGNVLYHVGGPWPGQDLGRPLGEALTWSVTYQRGVPLPAGVDTLTGILAKEIIDALDNEGVCRLPRTVTTASRQGVTYRAYDPAVIYANGKTGLPEVDMWLAAVNPRALQSAPRVI